MIGGYVEATTVGGHSGALSRAGRLYKPLPLDARGEVEQRFYNAVCSPERQSRPPATLMPKFYSVIMLHAHYPSESSSSDSSTSNAAAIATAPACEPAATCDSAAACESATAPPPLQRYLELEDVTARYARPCVMDVKMGVQTWAEDAPLAKIAREAAKYGSHHELGYRIVGMRMWVGDGIESGDCRSRCSGNARRMDSGGGGGPTALSHGYRTLGRDFGYALTPATAASTGLRAFLSGGSRLRIDVLPPLLERLLELRAWIAVQEEFRFHGSSLLLTYEGADEEDSVRDGDGGVDGGSDGGAGARPPSPVADVRMIDFAHVWSVRRSAGGDARGAGASFTRSQDSDERDSGYLLGLDSLIGGFLSLAATPLLPSAREEGAETSKHVPPAGSVHTSAASAVGGVLPVPLEALRTRWHALVAVHPAVSARGHHFRHALPQSDALALDASAAAVRRGAATRLDAP